MRASLIGAGLFAIVAVGCSGSKGDNLFGPGGTEVTGGGGSGADDSSTGPGGSSLTGTGGGSSTGGSVGTGGATPGTGGAGTGGRGTAGGAGTTGTGGTVVRPDAGSAGTGGVIRPDAASTPDVASPVDAAPDVGGGGAVVACGNDMCTVGAQQCCDTNNPTCVGLNAGAGVCPVNAPRLRCDDGNDCPGAQVCCATPAGGGQQTDLARCTQLANCPAMGAQILCDPADPNACPRPATPTCSVTQAGLFRNRPFCN